MSNPLLIATCEGCEAQPTETYNAELIGGVEKPLRVTLCVECLDLANSVAMTDPRYVALVNRIVDFKQGWPDKALINRALHAVSLVGKDDKEAIRVLMMREGEVGEHD